MSRIIALIAFCVLPFISAGCEKVPLLAPTGSTIFLTLGDSTNLGLNSSVQVSAVVTEQGGTPPHNGTVVTFTTTLGSVNPIEARTTNGLASTTFNTGSRSGTATVRAFSGAAGTGESTASADVTIGGAGVGMVSLRVESTSADGTVYHIVGVVVDTDGNRVPGAPVTFTANAGAIVTPASTNADGNGEARTTVTINAATTLTANSGAGTGTLDLPAPGSLAILQTTPAAGTAAEVGSPVTFTLTPTSGFFTNVTVDFGDGPPQNIGTVSAARTITHTYAQRGVFTVTARGTSSTGATSVSQTSVTVNERAPVGFTIGAPQASLAAGGVVAFTVTLTSPAGAVISRVNWTFGDGQSGQTTGPTTTHRYSAAGAYNVGVTVTTTDGRQGSGSTTAIVTP